MIKTLYISDLDGTLLDAEPKITAYTRDVINRFTGSGGHFTVATARSLDSAAQVIGDLKLNVPAALLGGVYFYDTQTRRYMKIAALDPPCAADLFKTLAEAGVTGFVYAFVNGGFKYYYENLDAPHRKEFHDVRAANLGRVYQKTASFSQLCDQNISQFAALDDYGLMLPVYERLKDDNRFNIEFYRDIYHESFWFMEISPAAASKRNAVLYLKETYGFDRVVCFGDNLNDLPMFEVSDECYATANAKEQVKAKATAVIGANSGDGVARWMEERFL